jgi:hypothetical protein
MRYKDKLVMATKHIRDDIWQAVQAETVRATKVTGRPIRDTELLNLLIIEGLTRISDDYWRHWEHLDMGQMLGALEKKHSQN